MLEYKKKSWHENSYFKSFEFEFVYLYSSDDLLNKGKPVTNEAVEEINFFHAALRFKLHVIDGD